MTLIHNKFQNNPSDIVLKEGYWFYLSCYWRRIVVDTLESWDLVITILTANRWSINSNHVYMYNSILIPPAHDSMLWDYYGAQNFISSYLPMLPSPWTVHLSLIICIHLCSYWSFGYMHFCRFHTHQGQLLQCIDSHTKRLIHKTITQVFGLNLLLYFFSLMFIRGYLDLFMVICHMSSCLVLRFG